MTRQPPPPYHAPAGPPSPGAPVRKKGFFDDLRGLSWWQLVLVFLPLGLIAIGGILGGALGGLGFAANAKIARSNVGDVAKLFAMVGVVIAAFFILLLVSGLIYLLTHTG